MNAEQLNQALYDKMAAEQERFKHNLLGLSTEEVLNHAYEYAMRQDILVEMEALELPADQAAALLASPTPMADVYRQWGKVETHHMEDIRDVIEELAGSMLETQREATRAIPLYQENARYAKEHGEIELFRASQEANIACRDAIDTAIQEGYDGMHLHADVKGVLAEFGPERVSHVLAATLLDKTWDQRISRDNQAWAASVPMFDTGTRHHDYAPRSHPLLLDGFVHQVRKEINAMQQQAEKKPSIKEQLAAKPVPGETPAKPRDREAR